MVWIILVIFILALLILSGCKKPVKPNITKVLLSVPYEKVQGKDWCLPASGAMVFKYYGENITQSVIANRVIIKMVIILMLGNLMRLGYLTHCGLLLGSKQPIIVYGTVCSLMVVRKQRKRKKIMQHFLE